MTYGLQPPQGAPLWTVDGLAAKADAAGFEWLIADARSTPDPVGLRNACHVKEMLCGVWEAEVDYGSPPRAARGYDFYVGQVEGPNQYDRLVQSIPAFRQEHPMMPAAVVTNMGGFEDDEDGTGAEKAKPFIAAGFACIVECWIKTDGVGPAERVDYATRVLGWPSAQPMAGLGENGATLTDYPTLGAFPGYSVFAAEELFT